MQEELNSTLQTQLNNSEGQARKLRNELDILSTSNQVCVCVCVVMHVVPTCMLCVRMRIISYFTEILTLHNAIQTIHTEILNIHNEIRTVHNEILNIHNDTDYAPRDTDHT